MLAVSTTGAAVIGTIKSRDVAPSRTGLLALRDVVGDCVAGMILEVAGFAQCGVGDDLRATVVPAISRSTTKGEVLAGRGLCSTARLLNIIVPIACFEAVNVSLKITNWIVSL